MWTRVAWADWKVRPPVGAQLGIGGRVHGFGPHTTSGAEFVHPFFRARYSLGRQPVHFLNVLEKTNGFA